MWREWCLSLSLLVGLVLLSACGDDGAGAGGLGASGVVSGGLRVSSPAVAEGGNLPSRNCAFGDNRSPPLAIAGVPVGCTGLLLICDDPDAVAAFGATYAHWLLADLPPATTGLAEGADAGALPAGTRRGRSSGGGTGWEGPWPPAGERHRYRLRVYALSANPLGIDLSRSWTRAQFEATYAGRILATGDLSFVALGPPG